MTFMEAMRQPSGLMVSLLISIFMFMSPSFSTFNLGNGGELLRTNLLSTTMIGGVFYISMISTSLFYKELNSGTILSLLSKPVSITHYYLSKTLGVFLAMTLFFVILITTGLMSMIIGTPDSASSKLNFLPIYFVLITYTLIFLISAALNYLTNSNLISFMFIGWGISNPIIILLVYWLSPLMGKPLPEGHMVIEFFKASLMLFLLMLIVSSFAVSLSSFTGPVLNLVLCVSFLMLGLMSPGLQAALGSDVPAWISSAMNWLPNFHLFWELK